MSTTKSSLTSHSEPPFVEHTQAAHWSDGRSNLSCQFSCSLVLAFAFLRPTGFLFRSPQSQAVFISHMTVPSPVGFLLAIASVT